MPNPKFSERIATRIPSLIGFGVPFILVVYLALEGGGYDIVVRSQVGILIWWIVLLGILIGVLPLARVTRAGWSIFGVLVALAAWTALGALTWTETAERSMIEVSRVAALAGVFLLLTLLQGRDSLKRSVAAIGFGVALVAVIALASRFHPGWFPASEIPDNYPVARLSYPLEYWNGLAAFMAIGLAPLLWLASHGRMVGVRSLAAGLIPLLVLVGYLTASRGGMIAALCGLVVLFAISPKRMQLASSLVIPAVGSVALILLLARRPEIRDLGDPSLASSQGTEMIWLTLGVFVLVAVGQGILTLAIQRRRIVIPEIGRKTTRVLGLSAAGVALIVLVVALASGQLGDRWSEFKEPAERDGTVSRLSDVSSGERYLGWKAALDAGSSEKLTGIGPGAFEFWWAREGDGSEFFRDAHSLYLESLAELGPVGFILILLLIGGPLVLVGRRSVGPGSAERRTLLSAATSAMVAFAVSAGIDWSWEMTVLPVTFLVLAAAALGPSGESRRERTASRFAGQAMPPGPTIGLVAIAVLSLVVIAIPLAGTSLVRSSQELAGEGRLGEALEKADAAVKVQPYSSSAEIQRSLLLKEMAEPEEASDAAREAVDDEATNWRTWMVLGTTTADPREAERALARAHELNPNSDLVTGLLDELRARNER